MWTCRHCGAEVDQDWDTCWQCVRIRDDAPPETFATQPLHDSAVTQLRPTSCPVCSSTRLLRHVTIVQAWEQGTGLEAIVQRPGRRLLRRGEERSGLHAEVCGTCGYVMWFVDHPERLWQTADDDTDIDELNQGSSGS